jgi:DNA-binding MarR family transcriptional regulator
VPAGSRGAQASVSATVLSAARKLNLAVDAAMHGEGLGVDHWLVLHSLHIENGSTMAELQTSTMAAGPTLTRVVDRLVSDALAYRDVDAADRRKVRVYLSDRGRDIHARVAPDIAAAELNWLRQEAAALDAVLQKAPVAQGR